MKNKYFSALMAFCILTGTAVAQSIPNYSFENWVTDTNYLSLAIPGSGTLLDTATGSDPVNWTTSNDITNGRVLKHTVLVTQSANSHVGNSSIKLRSDSINTTITAGFSVTLAFVCPGFAVCGKFPINLSSVASLGATFDPAALPGAGIRVTGRKRSIGGYLKYQPVGGDSAYIVAVLRQGPTVVARATYLRMSTDPAFTYFEAPFIYENCLVPDTLVYTLSSGNPYSISNSNPLTSSGTTGMHIGSTLYADSIFVSDTLAGFVIPPFTVDDSAHTNQNIPVTVYVGTNDVVCSAMRMIATVTSQPHHGSAMAAGDSVIYTPATGYYGMDTFWYTATAGGSAPSMPAMSTIRVARVNGIIEATESKVKVYPNPAANKLQISTSNPAISRLRVIDMLGNEVKTESMNTSTTLDVSAFDNGLYIIQFSNNEGKVLTSSRFTVIK